MQSEVTITVKGEDTTFKKKFNCYDEEISINPISSELNKMVDAAKWEFKGEPEEIKFNISGYF